MITQEEKDEIVNLAMEKTLLALPETVGHLITNHLTMVKLNEEFYKENPEFKGNKADVAAIMEMVEGENPLESYAVLLAKAIPRIRERIAVTKGLNTTDVNPNVNRDFSSCGEL